MWLNFQTVAAKRMSGRPVGATGLAARPVVIDSDEDYQRAIERVGSLRFDRRESAIDMELVALADAMLRWELSRHAFRALDD